MFESMSKAYDVSFLGKAMKKPALAALEKFVDEAYLATKEFLRKSAALTSTPIDDLAVSAVGAADGVIQNQIDKIDGEEG